MASQKSQYRPDYAVSPGWVLEERLDAHGMTHAEFARRCDRSPKLISEIIAGKAPIVPETAFQFELVLGVDASIWLGIEADYRLYGIRAAAEKKAEAAGSWSRSFPVKDLAKRGVIRKSASTGKAASELLAFFGVASVNAWKMKYENVNIAFRHSPSFESDRAALTAWLRITEIDAQDQDCGRYDVARFRKALAQVRHLTRTPVREALKNAKTLLNEAGVALSLVKPLPKTRVSGAAWWVSPNRPVVALSGRHKTDDHLWFSLFHEAAHIMLHGKKNVYVDGSNGGSDEIETEANQWAVNLLIPGAAWNGFLARGSFRSRDVCDFADELQIAPGIVVGRLQHTKQIEWNHLNRLKTRLRWSDE
ncbi:MAG: ImmA/IrrE family metallo-endopeptidase [Gemmatimonadetes bacterium]|nr:ImmA/IrrE family metallo-endopeptidase [Gemmatimonadota bacterium]